MRSFPSILRIAPFFSNSWGWQLFQLGLFVLPSSAFFSALFLLPALVIGSLHREKPFWMDYWNWPFIIASILMVIGSLNAYTGWLAFVGLGNWLPFFWSFWGFQPYLNSSFRRRRCAFLFIAGTVPVLITGFGQLWFGWQGPWQSFGGLIIWFIAPGGEPFGRLSGLFDYANIAGAWLALVWPFFLAALLQKDLGRISRIMVLILAVGIVAAMVLTDSRNAWGALMLAIPLVFGPSSWKWLLPVLAFFLLPILLAITPGVPFGIQEFSRKLVPENIWSRLNDIRYLDQRPLATTRLSQWRIALDLIFERPWLGWGAAAFSVLYPLRTGQWHGHAHNLPLEIGVSHGLFTSLMIVSTVLMLLIVSLKLGVLHSKSTFANFDRAWWTSAFILVIIHATDMPFFDSRLNIAGWILFAGLRCFIQCNRESLSSS